MVCVTATTHRRFAYETPKHDPSWTCSWSARHRRGRGRDCRRCRGAELHHEHEQYDDYAASVLVGHHHDAIHHDAEDADTAAGLDGSPVPEHGQVRVGLELGIGLEFGLGL
jgi:hypothetical protein